MDGGIYVKREKDHNDILRFSLNVVTESVIEMKQDFSTMHL